MVPNKPLLNIFTDLGDLFQVLLIKTSNGNTNIHRGALEKRAPQLLNYLGDEDEVKVEWPGPGPFLRFTNWLYTGNVNVDVDAELGWETSFCYHSNLEGSCDPQHLQTYQASSAQQEEAQGHGRKDCKYQFMTCTSRAQCNMHEMLELYFFATEYDIELLKNDIVESLISIQTASQELPNWLFVQQVAEKFELGSRLLSYLADLFARNWSPALARHYRHSTCPIHPIFMQRVAENLSIQLEETKESLTKASRRLDDPSKKKAKTSMKRERTDEHDAGELTR